MPGLEPGIQAALSVIIRGRRPWMHGSSPCMTKTDAQRLFLGGAKLNLTLLNVTSAARARKISRVAPRRFEFRSKLSLTAVKFREIDAHFRLSHQPTSFERGLS
jgi:hypothetical protein